MKVLKWIALTIASVAFSVVAFRMIRVWQEMARKDVRDGELKKNIHYSNEHFEELVKAKVIEIAQAENTKIEELWKARFGVKED